MRILLNVVTGPLGKRDLALSVGEDEDGTIVVSLIGVLQTSYLNDQGKPWFVECGYAEFYPGIVEGLDAEEIADAARCIALRQEDGLQEALSEELRYDLRRIADVLYGAWEESLTPIPEEAATPG